MREQVRFQIVMPVDVTVVVDHEGGEQVKVIKIVEHGTTVGPRMINEYLEEHEELREQLKRQLNGPDYSGPTIR